MAETKNTTVEDLLTPPVTEDVAAVEAATTEPDKKETTKTTEKKTGGRKKSEASKTEGIQVEEFKAPDKNSDAPAEDNKIVAESEEPAEVKEATTTDSKHPPDVAAGTRIEIPTLIRLYTTAFVSTYTKTVGGKLYIYADNVVNGRIRLTDSADKVGKPGGCIGWAEVNSIVRYIK